MATSTQKYAELKRLSKTVKQSIFDMLAIADELLADTEFVDQYGGEAQLIDHLEANEFSHFGGRPSLSEMLRAFRKNPAKSAWAEYKFNIQAMIELAKPVKEAAEVERINWKQLAKELEQRVESLEATLADYKANVSELRDTNQRLVSENGELRGRAATLERLANRRGELIGV